MAYSATLANIRGLISDQEHRRILNLFSRAGLSMDHIQFDEEILDKGTAAILKTRDGKLRAAVPHPIGSCTFINDVSAEELNAALRKHKEIMKEYPRNGEGIEAYVDASDTGYTDNNKTEVEATEKAAQEAGDLNGKMDGSTQVKGDSRKQATSNGVNGANGANGIDQKIVNGVNGLSNGVNGFTNGAH